MPDAAHCDKCNYDFSAKRVSRQGRAKCPVCGGPCPVAGRGGEDDVVIPGAECDGCGRRLPKGVTFCAACGTHNYAADAKTVAVMKRHNDRMDRARGRLSASRILRMLSRIFR